MIGDHPLLKTVNVVGFHGYAPTAGFTEALLEQIRILEPYPSSWGYVDSPWSWVESIEVSSDQTLMRISFSSALNMTVDLRHEDNLGHG